MSDGKQWPIGIITSIMLIVLACAVTIYVALLQPVQEDTDMMIGYHALDANANDVIVAGINFNKKYHLTYIGESVCEDGSRIAYRIEDLNGNPIDTANIQLSIVRPVVHSTDLVKIGEPRIENGNYYFDNVKVPEQGRWNILARVSVGDDFRHINLKSDTIDKHVYEYGFDKPMRNSGANN